MLAAAALRCVGGQMQGRLLYETEEQIERVRAMGHRRPEAMFLSGGNGQGRRDVRRHRRHARGHAARRAAPSGHGAITHSIVMRSQSGTVRYIEAHHNFEQKTWTPT